MSPRGANAGKEQRMPATTVCAPVAEQLAGERDQEALAVARGAPQQNSRISASRAAVVFSARSAGDGASSGKAYSEEGLVTLRRTASPSFSGLADLYRT
jgi:hypothetical protein